MGDNLKFGGLSNSRSLRTSPLKWCGKPPVRRTASRGRIPENGTKTTVCITISCLEFDGDSQVSSALLSRNDNVVRCPVFPLQIPICVPRNDTKRVGLGTKTNHVRHVLSVGPAEKFQSAAFLDNPVSAIMKKLVRADENKAVFVKYRFTDSFDSWYNRCSIGRSPRKTRSF